MTRFVKTRQTGRSLLSITDNGDIKSSFDKFDMSVYFHVKLIGNLCCMVGFLSQLPVYINQIVLSVTLLITSIKSSCRRNETVSIVSCTHTWKYTVIQHDVIVTSRWIYLFPGTIEMSPWIAALYDTHPYARENSAWACIHSWMILNWNGLMPRAEPEVMFNYNICGYFSRGMICRLFGGPIVTLHRLSPT